MLVNASSSRITNVTSVVGWWWWWEVRSGEKNVGMF
jgi:hypothetical protein